MKKVIDGALYNTDTAKCLGSYQHGYNRDLAYCWEGLYRTKSGKYFIFGEGGPMSKYAVHESYSTTTGGERIMPVSYDEAKAWAEEHLDGDEYEAAFGAVEDAGIYLELDGAVRLLLEQQRGATGKSIKELITDAVNRAYGNIQ